MLLFLLAPLQIFLQLSYLPLRLLHIGSKIVLEFSYISLKVFQICPNVVSLPSKVADPVVLVYLPILHLFELPNQRLDMFLRSSSS
ncbi:hypothetical protein BCR39DRAFT_509791 [Naematelia encephala]|uniref:Uncharacterized protein n=1 Tax=Naematelia encephala TaxID=71784 RepID=A0A1Y2BKZ5_9TREE|nr:hypothetical protein BCR39DRAFT_509791 [Naematelia encephala]